MNSNSDNEVYVEDEDILEMPDPTEGMPMPAVGRRRRNTRKNRGSRKNRNMSGGRRRRGSRKNRKSRKNRRQNGGVLVPWGGGRRNRRNSRKNRRNSSCSSRKSRRGRRSMYGGAGSNFAVDAPMLVPESYKQLIPESLRQQAGLHQEWADAANPSSMMPKH